jgi:hypothetical protein
MPGSISIQKFSVPPLDMFSNLGAREAVEAFLSANPTLEWIQVFRRTAQRYSRELIDSCPRIEGPMIVFEAKPSNVFSLCRELMALCAQVSEASADEVSPVDLERRQNVHDALMTAVEVLNSEIKQRV